MIEVAIYSLFLISLLPLFILMVIDLKKSLHMAQQNSYNKDFHYLKWIFKDILELPIDLNIAAQELYKAKNGNDIAVNKKYTFAFSITSWSILPKIHLKRGALNISAIIISAEEIDKTIQISCFAEDLAFSKSFLPINWEITTAPPPARAVNKYIISRLTVSTKETPETAASPALATIIESAIPVVIARVCSSIKGIIIFAK